MKAYELMKSAAENPKEYEGKRYKVIGGNAMCLGEFFDIIEICKDCPAVLVGDITLVGVGVDGKATNRVVSISTRTELEEIKPEPRPVTFMEAVKAEKRVKVVWQPLGIDSRYLPFNELIRKLDMFNMQELITCGHWYIEE